MTPDIKQLLRRKNQGRKYEASASAVAIKIGRSIARFNSCEMRRLDKSAGTRQLWQCVKNLMKPGRAWSNGAILLMRGLTTNLYLSLH